MREKTKEDFLRILDTFATVDDGGSYVALKSLIEEMDGRAAKGDEAARQVIDIMTRFSGLIKSAEEDYYVRKK